VPKLPPDEHNHYSIIVTKDGYSSDQTYPRTAQNPNALNPDINVISQQVTNATFVIDRLSKINLSFLDQNGNRVPGINFKLSGGDLIYNNPDTKRFDSNFTSDLNGQITIPDLKFDSYTIEVLTTGYYLISTVPVSDINLPSGTSLDAKAILSASSTNPAATGVSPMTGVSPDNATVTITGRNFSNNTSVKMINRSSGFEITGKNITAKAQKELSADFDLAGAETGEYDLFIQNINGEKVTQEKAFSVVSN
jgi:hypothetical protein